MKDSITEIVLVGGFGSVDEMGSKVIPRFKNTEKFSFFTGFSFFLKDFFSKSFYLFYKT